MMQCTEMCWSLWWIKFTTPVPSQLTMGFQSPPLASGTCMHVAILSKAGKDHISRSCSSAESFKRHTTQTAPVPIVSRMGWPATIPKPKPTMQLGKWHSSHSEASPGPAIPVQATSTSPSTGETGSNQQLSRSPESKGVDMHTILKKKR